MASSDYFLQPLLESVRDRCMLPASEDALSNVRLTRIINDELQGYMSELLIATREEYLLQTTDVAATNQARVRIPKRAAAAGIRQLTIVAGGSETTPERLEPERARLATRPSFGTPTYIVEGDDVVFDGPITSQQQVRFRYHYMPQLVDATVKGAQIATIAPNRATFTYVFNAGVVEPVLPALVDFIRIGGGNQPMGLDTAMQAINTGTLTVTLGAGFTVPDAISVGDFAIGAGTTIIPPLPEAFMPLLCQRAAYVALRAIGDQKADAALLQLQEMRQAAWNLLQPRTMSSPRYVINRHAPGWW
jgi:hypothetical protein